jgi:hypothetical protein
MKISMANERGGGRNRFQVFRFNWAETVQTMYTISKIWFKLLPPTLVVLLNLKLCADLKGVGSQVV